MVIVKLKCNQRQAKANFTNHDSRAAEKEKNEGKAAFAPFRFFFFFVLECQICLPLPFSTFASEEIFRNVPEDQKCRKKESDFTHHLVNAAVSWHALPFNAHTLSEKVPVSFSAAAAGPQVLFSPYGSPSTHRRGPLGKRRKPFLIADQIH